MSILELKEFKDVRSLYDVFFYEKLGEVVRYRIHWLVFFYEKLGEVVRYRIHWLVSLYYFYSRTFLVALMQGSVFSVIFLLLLVPSPPGSAGLISGITNSDLHRRSEILLIVSYAIAVIAVFQSRKGIKDVASFETALADYHKDEIREIARVSGIIGLPKSSTEQKTS